AGQLGLDLGALLHPEYRLVPEGGVGDAHLIQARKQLFGSHGFASSGVALDGSSPGRLRTLRGGQAGAIDERATGSGMLPDRDRLAASDRARPATAGLDGRLPRPPRLSLPAPDHG